MSDTLSTFEFFQKFPNEKAARNFFEKRRWPDEPVCGHCGSGSVTECKLIESVLGILHCPLIDL